MTGLAVCLQFRDEVFQAHFFTAFGLWVAGRMTACWLSGFGF